MSAYLLPGEPLPPYPVAVRSRLRRPLRRTLFAVAGGTAITSAFAYGLAVSSEAGFQQDHPDWSRADLLDAQARTNGLSITAAVSGVLSLGALTAGILVGPE